MRRALGLVLIARGAPGFRWSAPRAARARLRDTLGFGLPLQAANALGVLHQQVGKLLIVRLVSLASVVPYELGLRVSSASTGFAQLVLVAMIPEASVLHAQDASERLRELHRRAGRFVTSVGAIVTAALVASAPPLFHAWLGHADPNAAPALRGLAIAAYAALTAGVSSVILRGVGRTSIELEWSGLALVLHAALCVLLVPKLGLTGALIAIVIANVVSALWFAFRLARTLGWPVSWTLIEPFVFPVLAIAAGTIAGAEASRAIQSPWIGLGVAAASAGAACMLVLLVTRQLVWGEILGLVRRGVAR